MEFHGQTRQSEPTWTGMTPSPDPGFVKKMKEYSPDLGIRFSRNWGCFVITQKSKMSGDVPLFKVEGDHGAGYRQPDDRDMAAIHAADMWNRRDHDWQDVMREGEEYMLEAEAKSFLDAKQDIRDATKDDKIQLMNTYKEALGMGKTRNEFQRVQPKSKSKPSMGRHVTAH